MNTRIPIDDLNQVGVAQGQNGEGLAPASFRPGVTEAMAPASGEAEQGGGAWTHPFSNPGCNHCADALHELANTITAVLMNAQVMEWRLPPYSRLKRPVRKIERQAQRSSALLKRLLCQFERTDEATRESCQQVSCLRGTMAAVTAQGPELTATGPEKLPALAQSPSAPGSWLSPKNELTRSCDPCTSAFFPKEEG
jgi:hypothetical protein